MQELNKGDLIIGTQNHNRGIVRKIVEKRKSGYDWKYPEIDEIFMSENSNDPYFECGWEKIIK